MSLTYDVLNGIAQEKTKDLYSEAIKMKTKKAIIKL